MLNERLKSIARKVAKTVEKGLEDREVRRLSKPLPTTKPPRKDKKKTQIKTEIDPDLDKEPVEADPDLSMNYKKIAIKKAMRIFLAETSPDRFKSKDKAKRFFEKDYKKDHPNTQKSWEDFYDSDSGQSEEEEEDPKDGSEASNEAEGSGDFGGLDALDDPSAFEDDGDEESSEGSSEKEGSDEADPLDDALMGASDDNLDDMENQKALEDEKAEEVGSALDDIFNEEDPNVRKQKVEDFRSSYSEESNEPEIKKQLHEAEHSAKSEIAKDKLYQTYDNLFSSNSLPPDFKELGKSIKQALKDDEHILDINKSFLKEKSVQKNRMSDKSLTLADKLDSCLEGLDTSKLSTIKAKDKAQSIGLILARVENIAESFLTPELLLSANKKKAVKLNTPKLSIVKDLVKSFDMFPPEFRQLRAEKVKDKLDNLKDKTGVDNAYYQAELDALSLSETLQSGASGEWYSEETDEPPHTTKTVLKLLKTAGMGYDDCFSIMEDPSKPESRALLSDSLRTLNVYQLQDATKDDPEVSELLSSLEDDSLSDNQKNELKNIAIDCMVDDMSVWDYAVRDWLNQESQDEPETLLDRTQAKAKEIKQIISRATNKLKSEFEIIGRNQKNRELYSPSVVSDYEAVQKTKELGEEYRIERLSGLYNHLKENNFDDKKSSSGVALRDIINRGDLSILDTQQTPSFAKRMARNRKIVSKLTKICLREFY